MSASKRQGIIAIGVGCILVSVLLVFYGISQPKVNETPLSQLQDTLSQTSIKTSSSDKNSHLLVKNIFDIFSKTIFKSLIIL